ncbi:MAG: FHA domain-containing protein [Okeania sp. SIO2C2]|uniref:FHA domain-containing protein n=1 Tax=Okeania sp. SIO2C2 TaxID=2607787 RepID=UPI0013B9E0CA|nr:FHA domain-containing protein [Okeania sp. SIO2C2]NEP88032.1 FHA domain-containing protein [Okeania sp. SIO2C2]
MAINCNVCFYDRNSDKNQFCEVCGSEIQPSITLFEAGEKGIQEGEKQTVLQTDQQTVNFHQRINQNINNNPVTAPVYTNIQTSSPPTLETAKKAKILPKNSANPTLITGTIAKLIPKQVGSPVPEFIIDSNNALIGKFDPNIGPVEIDLDGFYGDETVSSTHAEIYFENNQWQIKDMGSTHGIYIKPTGKTRFGYRTNKPEILNSGDEIAIGKIRLLFLII